MQPSGDTSETEPVLSFWKKITRLVSITVNPVHLKRTLLIALLVGSWLNAANHAEAILSGAFSIGLVVKLALNYLTPFVVANIGLLARELK